LVGSGERSGQFEAARAHRKSRAAARGVAPRCANGGPGADRRGALRAREHKSYGLGGNHFITKPEDPAELETRLRSLLNNLSEMRGVTRGSGVLETTAQSVMQPGSLAMRRGVAWGMAVGIMVGLLIFALVIGVIG